MSLDPRLSQEVAIKKVLQDKRFKNRELQIMKMLDHTNVTTLLHYFYTEGEKAEETYLNLVMDFVPQTVYSMSRQYAKAKKAFPTLFMKLYTYQLCRSLAYIHSLGVCHRDIKPQNLLVHPETHMLKLCDFGSAKILVKGEPNVSYICSRYYRAPELIFGATDYTCCIDVWSAGCVLAELLLGVPLFPGESGVDQLVEIIKVLGTPSLDEIQQMHQNYSEYKFPQVKPHPWSKSSVRDAAGSDRPRLQASATRPTCGSSRLRRARCHSSTSCTNLRLQTTCRRRFSTFGRRRRLSCRPLQGACARVVQAEREERLEARVAPRAQGEWMREGRTRHKRPPVLALHACVVAPVRGSRGGSCGGSVLVAGGEAGLHIFNKRRQLLMRADGLLLRVYFVTADLEQGAAAESGDSTTGGYAVECAQADAHGTVDGVGKASGEHGVVVRAVREGKRRQAMRASIVVALDGSD